MFPCTRLTAGVLKRPLPLVVSSGRVGMSTVDPSEMDRFAKLKDQWSLPHGMMKPLHSFNELRIPFIKNGLAQTGRIQDVDSKAALKGVSILDVGCGGGILSIPLARLGAAVTGIDPNKEAIEVAKLRMKAEKGLDDRLSFQNVPVEEYAMSNEGRHDAVILSEVVEHVTAKQDFLKSCVSTLKPEGSVFITTISKTFAAWFAAIILAENVIRVLPKNTHDYNKLISPEELSTSLDKLNCKTVLVHGTFYNPLTNKWSWVGPTVITYSLHAQKRN